MTDRGGNLLGDIQSIGVEVDVVSDKRHPRAEDRGAGGLVRRGRAEVRRPAWRRHLRRQPLEFAPANILEVLSCRVGRRFLVEKHGDPEAFGHLGTNVFGNPDAIRHGHALDRNEWHDVDCAHARMLATMGAQVDGVYGDRKEREDRGFDRGLVAGEREH